MIISKKQSGFTKAIIILIVAILIAAGGAGYYFYKTLVDETADWKTYRDEQNEWYEIRYPSNWSVSSGIVNLASTVTFRYWETHEPVFLEILATPNWDGFLAEEWWDEKNRQDEISYIKKDSIIIDGVKALVFQATTGFKEEHYVFTKGLGLYDIFAPSATADRKIIKQILSTFKVIGKESETVRPSKEEIVEITGKVNVIDDRMIELVSKDGTGYVLRTHPVLVYMFDLSNIPLEDCAELTKGTRDILERRANLFGVDRVLVRTAGFSKGTKLIIEPMIDPATVAKNFVDEFRKVVGKTPFLEFRLEGKAIGLSGKHLRRAQLDFGPETNKPVISLKFNKEGEQIFEELTTKNIGKELAIYLDGTSIYSFIIQNSNPIITGDFTVDGAKQLVRFLNVGALPVPIYPVSQQNKINMEELRKLHGKTISVKGYLLGEEAVKKTIYVVSFETK